MIDVNKVRQDTIGCHDKIFLDSAGSSLVPKAVSEAIRSYLEAEEKVGGYKLEEIRRSEIAEFYLCAAKLLNCHPRNIAFAHDATDAYTKALSSIRFDKGDSIITSNDDYISNQLNFLSLQKRFGIEIKRINNQDNGDLDIDHFTQLVDQKRPKLVAITFIPTNSGLVQDVAAIGKICREQQILYLVDGCQAVGQVAVDVNEIKCDFFSATGRKFLRGPRGSGFLYVSDGLLEAGFAPLLIDMRGAKWTSADEYDFLFDNAKRFETWESPYSLKIGLKEAMKYANEIGIQHIEAYNQELVGHFRNDLSQLKHVNVLEKGSRTCNIITFKKMNVSLEKVQQALENSTIFYSVSRRDYAVIDFDRKHVDWAIRLAPHYFNTTEELNKALEVIDAM